ncbi:MAG: Rab family GTPase [Candidatus Kariarchaeaceae archaeon]
MSEDPSLKIKLIVIGEPAVGKTTLVSRFTTGFTPDRYLITLGVNVTSHKIELNDEPVLLQIFDIAGQKQFSIIRRRFYLGSQGAIAVFDLTNEASIEALPGWIEEFHRYCGDNRPVIILGNKSDLEYKKVTEEKINDLLAKLNIPKENLIITSAVDGVNVDQSFEKMAYLILEAH